MKSKKTTLRINKTSKIPCIKIVSSSIILQRNFADGQAIPLLILDTRDYPQVAEALELHSGLRNGKIDFCLCNTLNNKIIILEVNCISPVEISYNIIFDLDKDYALLEMILMTHLFYIQAGKPGDRLSKNLNLPKMLIELDISEYETKLKKYIYQAKRRHYIHAGIPKKNIDNIIEEFDKEWGTFTNRRFK